MAREQAWLCYRDSGKDGIAREVPNEFTRATAYFSQRPPALPMQIIAVTPRAISDAEVGNKKTQYDLLVILSSFLLEATQKNKSGVPFRCNNISIFFFFIVKF